MDGLKRVPTYLVSLPERSARATAALLGGAVKETGDALLPDAVRDSRLYQTSIGRLLRIVVEGVGGVSGVYPPDAVGVGELMKRKAAGNAIELASIVATGLSPLWVLAAVADLTGGSKAYLRELVEQLRADRLLPADADAANYEELLNRLEASSGMLADAVDVPPLSVAEARQAFGALRAQGRNLPGPDELAAFWTDLRETAQREGVSTMELSAALGAAAARAGKEITSEHLADFYRGQLDDIRDAGLRRWLLAAALPYTAGAVAQFDPDRESYTERALGWVLGRKKQGGAQAPRPPRGGLAEPPRVLDDDRPPLD
ncbi:MAG: hypothetical protein ACR2J8_13885 [Thermomicrobiales bacterium]